MTRPAILLDELNGDLNDEAGNKFANLGDIRNTLGLPTMDGFVITTRAFFDFMSANGLLRHIETISGSGGTKRTRGPSRPCAMRCGSAF